MNRYRVDITGLRSGYLVALEPTSERYRRQVLWRAKCDCGSVVLVPGPQMQRGAHKSCGCMYMGKKRGLQKHPLYSIHLHMMRRCTNPTSKDYKSYGGRGITVCEEWHDLEKFAADMGPRPSAQHSVDRIDNNGPYAPWNCRWATPIEQQNNKSNNVIVDLDGQPTPLAEACRKVGANHSKALWRVRNNRDWRSGS